MSVPADPAIPAASPHLQSVPQSLSRKTIAITGATGFLGTALVEKLLRAAPDCHLVLLVRPGRRGPKKRIGTEILNNDAFARLRKELGDEEFQKMADERITALPADITKENLGLDFENLGGTKQEAEEQGIKKFLETDIFIHSAAAVSFTSTLDMAIDTNLLGPIRIIELLKNVGMTPHLLAVSTAYVAGNRQGYVAEKLLKENPFTQEIDYEAEIISAKSAEARIENESRSKKMLDSFDKKAREHLGSPGTSALSKRREQLRKSWVKDQLVELGKSRAASLGFPDIYGLTKAMAETAICERQDNIPVTFVRPSIIESALKEPFPGWIRGFRMAEPIIISYARGLLKDFPAKPEGILDVIPVDLVVSAILIQAAKPAPDPSSEPEVIHVASGSVNPFLFENLHDWCYNWFTQNPVYDEANNPISPHRWSYPSRTRVQKQLTRASKAIAAGEAVIRKLPIRGTVAQTAAALEERRTQLERALGYVDLYGMYLECEAVFGVEKLLADFADLSAGDKELFSCDPQTIDWHGYLTEIHLPSVLVQGRVKTQPSKKSPATDSRSARIRKSILSPDRHLAVFDLENTIIASNVVASWGWLATKRLDPLERFKFVVKAFAEAPGLLSLERSGRGDFLKHFYRRFKNSDAERLHADSNEMFSDLLLSRSFPAAIRRIREHKVLGHKTLLITGALDFVVKPLEPLFDDIVSCELTKERGRYTGALKETAPIGELRAEVLRNYTENHSLDLQESVAYADSVSDIPMLEAVGFPVAVNPEVRLASIARRRGWLVENFSKGADYNARLLPTAPPL